MHDHRRRRMNAASPCWSSRAVQIAAILSLMLALASPHAVGRAAEPAVAQTASAPAEADPIALLLALSSETDAQARHDAAVKLLRLAAPQARQPVLALLASKSNDAAKLAVCEAIVEIGYREPELIQPLLALMQSRESVVALRRAAAAALAGFQESNPEVQEKLKVFRSEQDAILLAESHAALMRALYECTPETDRTALVQAWLKQPLALQRFWALDIVEKNLKKRIPDSALLSQLRLLLADPDESVRRQCVLVLRTLGEREDAPRLQKVLDQPQPAAVREAVYNALGVLGDPASTPVVIAGLSDASPGVAAEAATALARLIAQGTSVSGDDPSDAIEALLRRSAQPIEDSRLRERVIDAMSVIASPAFLTVLTAHAGPAEPLPAVRQAAVRGIGRVGNPAALPIISQQLSADPDAGVREAAAEALGMLGSLPEHLDRLRERLDAPAESSASVQARAWAAYLRVFAKLPVAAQQQVLEGWPVDGAGVSRRINLLTVIEKHATATQLPDDQLARWREQLGDALIAASRPADAAPVLARGLGAMKRAVPDDQSRVALKMIDSYLNSAPEKAAAAAAAVPGGPARDAVAERLLTFVETPQRDPTTAAALLQRVSETIPDLFGPRYAQRFEKARKLFPASTRPASAPAASP